MNAKELYRKIYTRIAREGLIKALLLGGSIGFAVMAITAFVAWFFSFNGVWLAIVGGVVFGAGFTVLFYFKAFKPTKESISKRLDRMGFEERFITMIEFENEDDYIYRLQREEAKTVLKRANRKKIALKVPVASIVAAAIAVTAGTSLTVVEALSENGKIKSGSEIIDRIDEQLKPDEYVVLSYLVEDGGYIEGEADQVFKKGGDGETVIAVEDDGWVFVCWTDEEGNELSDDPVRTDLKVEEDAVYIAVFQEGGSSGDGEGEGEGDPNGDPNGEPEDSDPVSDQDKNEEASENDPTDSQPGNSAGGGDKQENNNIQGDVYYRDVYDEYLDKEMGEDMSDEDRDVADDYFSAIK